MMEAKNKSPQKKFPGDVLEFQNSSQWRDWLVKNHLTQTHAWVLIYKKKYHPLGLSLDEAVEEAICYGWIDGGMRPVDERTFALRFAPRKAGSTWSISNINRVEKLLAEGKITEAGHRKIEEAKANGQWDAALRRELVDVIPEALKNALRETPGAVERYQALPASRKKQFIYWLQSAKRAETREKRIQKILEEL